MGININSRILLAAASIFAAAALVVGATFAYFSDVSSSNDNIFQSGNFDLQVADNDSEGFGDSVTASFVSPENWAPGEKFVDFICFKNNGTTDIQQVLFNLTSPNAGLGGVTLDDFVYVSSIELGPVTAPECEAAGGVGTQGLTDFTILFNSRFGTNAPLSSLLATIDGLNPVDDDLFDDAANKLAPGNIAKLRVEWTFDPLATSAQEGQSVEIDLGFNATQNEAP